MLPSSSALAVYVSVTTDDRQDRPPLPVFKQYPLHLTTLYTVYVTWGAQRWGVGWGWEGRTLICLWSCGLSVGESHLYIAVWLIPLIMEVTNVYVCCSQCVCVCGVLLLNNLTKLGKHFYSQCRQQNFMDKPPLSQWRHITQAVFTPARASFTSIFHSPFNFIYFPPNNP